MNGVPLKMAFISLRTESRDCSLQAACDALAEFVTAIQVRLKIWPNVHTGSTPSGLRTISIGVPSARYGMSSAGRMRAITPLLPWPSRHLVTDRQRALHGDIHLHHLDHAGRKFIAFCSLLIFRDDLAENVDLTRSHLFDLIDLLVHPRIFCRCT